MIFFFENNAIIPPSWRKRTRGLGRVKKRFLEGEIVQQATRQLCDGLGLVAD